MRRFFAHTRISLLLILLIPSLAFAQPRGSSVITPGGFSLATEEDGSPECFGETLKFADGNVIDNGDGSCSIADQDTGGVGSGDINQVGNCFSGACFTGTSGSVLTGPANTDFNFATSGVGRFTFTPTNLAVTIAASGNTSHQDFNISTGKNFTVGSTQWNSADEIDGTKIKDADYGDVDVSAGGAWTVSSVQNNAVTMATDTTGDFVGTITGGTGIDSTAATTGEDTDHTLSLDLTEATCGTGLTCPSAATINCDDANDDGSTQGCASFGNADFDAVGGNVTLAQQASSAWINLVSDPQGTGSWVFATSPSITTPTLTGSILTGSAQMPFGANPTVDSPGETAIDTTSGQWRYHDGTKVRNLHYEDTKCGIFEDLAAADDNFELYMADDAITITQFGCHCRGTCTTVAELSLEDRAGNAMTQAIPTCSTGTNNSSFAVLSGDNLLLAGEGLAFDVDNAVSPETDAYSICFKWIYTSD